MASGRNGGQPNNNNINQNANQQPYYYPYAYYPYQYIPQPYPYPGYDGQYEEEYEEEYEEQEYEGENGECYLVPDKEIRSCEYCRLPQENCVCVETFYPLHNSTPTTGPSNPPTNPREITSSNIGFVQGVAIPTVCPDLAAKGHCDKGSECPYEHGNPFSAMMQRHRAPPTPEEKLDQMKQEYKDLELHLNEKKEELKKIRSIWLEILV